RSSAGEVADATPGSTQGRAAVPTGRRPPLPGKRPRTSLAVRRRCGERAAEDRPGTGTPRPRRVRDGNPPGAHRLDRVLCGVASGECGVRLALALRPDGATGGALGRARSRRRAFRLRG